MTRWERKRAIGQCYSCPSPVKPDYAHCERCLERKAEEADKRYDLSGRSGSRGRGLHPNQVDKLREMDKAWRAAGRCKCGLIRPCLACVPTALELASSRPGNATYPEGGGE